MQQDEPDEIESQLHNVQRLLEELMMVCDPQILTDTLAGRNAQKYVVDNPLSPATSADRDGQRSYGL